MSITDPRARMRDALKRLLREQPPAWEDDASLARFRNLLLDETGSDARPLAELLLEALRRGWREQLPSGPLQPPRWDATVSPFVMRWSADCFIQPEMARWAAESWGFSLGVIGADQLRIAPPSAPTPHAPTPPRASAPIVPRTASPSRPPATPMAVATASAAAIARASAARSPTQRLVPRAGVPIARTRPSPARSSIPTLSPKVARGIGVAAALSYVFFIGKMAFDIRASRRADAAAAAVAAVPANDSVGRTAAVPPDSVQPVPVPPATAAAPVGTGGLGVPSVSGSALTSPGADSTRMLFVEPVRRAGGSSVPATSNGLTPARTDPIVYDELQLTDGSRMLGRVDIMRAGTVIFRDLRTGLRHEIRKDDIEQIITEFGTSVRFRAPGTVAPVEAKPTATAARGGKLGVAAPTMRAPATIRARGVGGRYSVRYDAATVNGSKDCASVWTRPPQAVDRATVTHVPDADTLNVAFDGGDNFPSNVDVEGFFASTPRIMPDQARTSTAFVTRLNGRFLADGKLSLTVSIVFFRRMRRGPDLACTVYVNATGSREAP